MPARTGSECLLLRFARFGAFWPRKVEVPLLSSHPGLFYARHREWRGTGSGAAQASQVDRKGQEGASVCHRWWV